MTEEEIKALQESVAKLEANNARLTSELKVARKNAEIKPEQLEAVELERDKIQADFIALQKQSKDAFKSVETLQEQLKQESGFTQKLLIDTGLTDELVKNGVAPQFLDATKALFSPRAKIFQDGENRIAKIDDKSVSDYIKEWATSDVGKHFVTAPANGGGGSQGGRDGQTNAKTWTREVFDNKSHSERAEFAKTGGTVVD